jgi:hypothetical protein
MKKLSFALTALASTMIAAPAFAQSADATGTVTIDGSVAGRCLFTTPSDVIHLGELSLGGSDTNAGKLDTSKVDGENRTLVGWCNNTAATMTVEAKAIENVDFTTTPPTGFARVINYTATADANSQSANDSSTTGGAGTPTNVGMFTGNVKVTLSNASAGGNLLVAGNYEGEVLVTLSPAVSVPE